MNLQAITERAHASLPCSRTLHTLLWLGAVLAFVGALLLRNPLLLPWRSLVSVLLGASTLVTLAWMGLRWRPTFTLCGRQTDWLLGLWLGALVIAGGRKSCSSGASTV